MSEHLWPLLRLKADSEAALKEKYREVYVKNYIENADGSPRTISDWQGNQVHFSRTTFDHAFSKSTDYRFNYGGHDLPFAPERARRILWIKETLAGSGGTIERRQQIRKDSRGRPRKRRLLIVNEEGYVVVLEIRNEAGMLEFITAFPADSAYLEKIRRESTLLEIKKPQS
jgi:hypothetical protein